jgi:hypothetical protein
MDSKLLQSYGKNIPMHIAFFPELLFPPIVPAIQISSSTTAVNQSYLTI